MNHLDLFSGIGGFALGLSWAGNFRTIGFAECDNYSQRVLQKHWPDVPIWGDVKDVDYDGSVDIITGGYPCQPFSVAGQRQGEADDRHVWPLMLGLIEQYRPAWVIGENVAGHINMGLDNVLADLERADYAARTFILPACAVNAPHRRDRVWVVAYNQQSSQWNSAPKNETGQRESGTYADDALSLRTFADAGSQRGQGGEQEGVLGQCGFSWCENIGNTSDYFRRSDIPEPLICGKDDGVPRMVDRLRG